MIKLMVDGVFFQINNTGIARVWKSIIEILAESGQYEILFLDRGNAPQIKGVYYIPFPRNLFSQCAADSFLIQEICDYYQIDVFTSTYYTTPVTTPMVLMVHDMNPELFDFDLTQRAWMEKDIAISYAQRYLSNSYNTRNDLLDFYPEIAIEKVNVAHCGVDESVFYVRDEHEINLFRKRFLLDREYFLFVGSRVQHNNYKNSQLFFNALIRMPKVEFDVFCVGGEKEIEAEIISLVPDGFRCFLVELTDDELALAYGGALALVYPSLYEGFGMPVIEAMASGCPVITTHNGSLVEAAGNAACLISGESVVEMCEALEKIQDEEYRKLLKAKGLVHSHHFRWQGMADALGEQLELLVQEDKRGIYDHYFTEWKALRSLQASVDYIR